MADIKTDDTMADPGDDDQWLYGDSNSNLDPPGTSVEDPVKIEQSSVPEDEVITFMNDFNINSPEKYCKYYYFSYRKHVLWNS